MNLKKTVIVGRKNPLFKHHRKLLPPRDSCCMVFKKKILYGLCNLPVIEEKNTDVSI